MVSVSLGLREVACNKVCWQKILNMEAFTCFEPIFPPSSEPELT
jgi:hypothetical protein